MPNPTQVLGKCDICGHSPISNRMLACPMCGSRLAWADANAIVPVLTVPVALSPQPKSGRDICSDCGKVMSFLDKAVNLVAGDNRCGDCDRLYKQTQIATRIQMIQDIISGQLPHVAANIVLQKSEVCHFASRAVLSEPTVVGRTRVGHSVGVRIRICRGVTYRAGASQGRAVPITQVIKVDEGSFYITSKRCVFDGARKSNSLPHAKLISFEPFANGLQLNPDGNKKAQILALQDGELAAAVLSGVLNS